MRVTLRDVNPATGGGAASTSQLQKSRPGGPGFYPEPDPLRQMAGGALTSTALPLVFHVIEPGSGAPSSPGRGGRHNGQPPTDSTKK